MSATYHKITGDICLREDLDNAGEVSFTLMENDYGAVYVTRMTEADLNAIARHAPAVVALTEAAHAIAVGIMLMPEEQNKTLRLDDLLNALAAFGQEGGEG